MTASPSDLRNISPDWVYVGTQRSGPGTGFSRATFDAAIGTLSPFTPVQPADDPGFFVIAPGGARLYTCNSGTPGGVSAYALDAATGALAWIGHHVSTGRGPSQLSLDGAGRFVLAANYGGGYVEVVAITPDGGLGLQTAFVQHSGHSVDPVRQTRPYAHCIAVDPTNHFALVADLGLDRVLVYRFDADTGSLSPHDPSGWTMEAGSGPRHLAWHPSGQWLYVIEELASRVTTFAWESARGRLHALQTVSALPRGFSGENTSAEILVHDSGHFLFASNRGHDSIAAFAIDPFLGTLSPIAHTPSGGQTPRYMAFDRAHRWLLVVNVDNDAVAVFGIDVNLGTLAPHGTPISVPRPYGIAVTAVRR